MGIKELDIQVVLMGSGCCKGTKSSRGERVKLIARQITAKALKWLEWLYTQAGWVAGGLAAIMMIAIVREVIGRYFFNNPSDWSLDLSCLLLVGMAYVGAAYVTLIEGHVRIDFIYRNFKGKTKIIMDIVICVICIAYGAIVVWQGWDMAWGSLMAHSVSTGGVRWPLFPSQAVVPAGSFFLCLCFVGKIIHSIDLLHKAGD